MKIVCLSDTHNKHNQIIVPHGDVLIHAGDLTPRGNYYEFISVARWFESLKDQFKYRIFIAGNHDWSFYFNAKKTLEDHFDKDIIYLQDEEVILDGIKFYGSPWVPIFMNWAFMEEDDDLARHWAKIPEDTDILITHGPPFDILDKEADKERCGSKTLYDRIKQLKQLKHHIFGHIHESYGEEKIGDVAFHNVCSLNGEYKYANPPVVIEI